MRAPGLYRLPGAAQVRRRRHDRGRHRGHWLARRGDGRRGSMSFHPTMPYGTEQWHRSHAGHAAGGPRVRVHAPQNRAQFEEFAAHYAPEHRKSAVLHALYLAQEQQGYISQQRRAPRRRGRRLHHRRSRGRRFLLRDVPPHAGRQVRAAGVHHALVRARRRRTRGRGTAAQARHQASARPIPTGMFTIMPMECLGACDRAPVMMVNNDHWHECLKPGAGGRARRPA